MTRQVSMQHPEKPLYSAAILSLKAIIPVALVYLLFLFLLSFLGMIVNSNLARDAAHAYRLADLYRLLSESYYLPDPLALLHPLFSLIFPVYGAAFATAFFWALLRLYGPLSLPLSFKRLGLCWLYLIALLVIDSWLSNFLHSHGVWWYRGLIEISLLPLTLVPFLLIAGPSIRQAIRTSSTAMIALRWKLPLLAALPILPGILIWCLWLVLYPAYALSLLPFLEMTSTTLSGNGTFMHRDFVLENDWLPILRKVGYLQFYLGLIVLLLSKAALAIYAGHIVKEKTAA